jgi:hypothetical protein
VTTPPGPSDLISTAVKESSKGCYGIMVDSSDDIAYALVGDTANSLSTYIIRVEYISSPIQLKFKRYMGLSKTFEYSDNEIFKADFLFLSPDIYLFFGG